MMKRRAYKTTGYYLSAVLVVILGLESNLDAGPPNQDSVMNIEKAKQVIENFEFAFAGKSAKILPVFAGRTAGQEYEYSLSKDCSFSRVFWDFSSTNMKKEGCQVDGQLIVASKEKNVDLFHVRGDIAPKNNIVSHFMFVPYLVGFSFDDGARYSQILEHESTNCSLETGLLANQEVSILKAKSPVFGSYVFWIGKAPTPRLLKIHATKQKGERYFESPSEPLKKIGESSSESTSIAELNREKIIYPIEYFEEGPNANIPERVGVRMQSNYSNGEKFEGEFHVEASQIKSFNKTSTDLELSKVNIWNGIQVEVLGMEGLAFELNDGRIKRVIDNSTIAQIDGVRYRKSKAKSLYFVMLMICVVLTGAVWVYSKKNE